MNRWLTHRCASSFLYLFLAQLDFRKSEVKPKTLPELADD
ncbi:hypothetical protein FDUTEX481_02841 [Tolypothrix sp. PCC 7601]|nr:hypothetical protein FDUTEX481_02841 [Tolypothrix sp. PCC 7601]